MTTMMRRRVSARGPEPRRAPKSRSYRCAHCRRVVLRESHKAWIKSWCTHTDRFTRLTRHPSTKTRAAARKVR